MIVLFVRGAAHLLVRAVTVMLYRAGANEDICAVDSAGKQVQSGYKDIFQSHSLVCYH